MEYRKIVTELSAQLGREALNDYMQKAGNAMEVFTMAFEDGKLSESLYNDYLVLQAEISA